MQIIDTTAGNKNPPLNNKYSDDEEEIIYCMPFSSGTYKNIVFEGRKIIFTNNPFYLLQEPRYGEIALDFFSLKILWTSGEIPEKLLKGIQVSLRNWKKHFD